VALLCCWWCWGVIRWCILWWTVNEKGGGEKDVNSVRVFIHTVTCVQYLYCTSRVKRTQNKNNKFTNFQLFLFLFLN
jgi:hypothetical protein